MINRTQAQNEAERGGSSVSGVSWGAIFAGAFAAAALSSILLILGVGLGFSSMSPWSDSGLSAETISYSTIGWITFTQIAASAMGGYMAGRLRVKWANIHSDEVYFRDTAHGFLSWAVASFAAAMLLGSAVSGVVSGGAKIAGTAGAAMVSTGAAGGAMLASDGGNDVMRGVSGYFIDTLFRPMSSNAGSNGAAQSEAPTASGPGATAMEGRDNAITPAQRVEVTRIFANAMRTGALPNEDKSYVAQLLARRTGVSRAEAEKRINDTYTAVKRNVDDAAMKAKEAADTARQAMAYGSMWMFVALLCGAFVASFSAIYGGRQRDRGSFAVAEPRISGSATPATAS